MTLDANRWERMQAVFERALEAPVHERPAVLDAACGDDPALRREIEAMLAVAAPEHALAIERLLVTDASEAAPSADPTIGQRFGAWRVVGVLGHGGMSTVYLAERADRQYEQRVALKIVRGGAFGEPARQFHAERQILARLSHPNIARLLDAGCTPDGSAYMVMEYVDGIPLTDYSDAHRLEIESRLRLFRIVCDATQHAHRALVVHRDLKPSNIFVSRTGDVKLLDFGIAKLLEGDTDSAGGTTRDGRALTPGYAAPEQLRREPVTTATDVYALGVVLYELLVGRRPFEPATKSLFELERLLMTTDPPPPSQAIEQALRPHSSDPAEVARVRRSTPARLARRLRGDLDRVVLKALRREPDRRYASAGQLAEEIDRLLEGRPIIARPDTLSYRTARFVGRNRVPVAASALVIVLLAVFSVLAVVQARRVTAERDRARLEQAKSEHVVRVLVDLFRTANPEVVPAGDRMSIGTFLARAESRVMGQLASQPELAATMRHVLGLVHQARSDNARARDLLSSSLADRRRMFGTHAVETLTVQVDLAELLVWLDEREEARRLLEEALPDIRRRSNSDRLAAKAYYALARVDPDVDQATLEQAVAISRRLPSDEGDRARYTSELAALHMRHSRFDRARALFEEALKDAERLGGPSTVLIQALSESAVFDARVGDFATAEAKHRRALALAEDLVGPDSVQVATFLNDLAVTVANQGRLREATDMFVRAYDGHVRIFGEVHWRTVNAMRNVGIAHLLQDDPRACETWMTRALRTSEAIAEPREQMVVYMRAQLARCLLRQQRVAEGTALLRHAIGRLQTIKGADPAYLANARLWLGRALLESGHADQAEVHIVPAVAFYRRTRDAGHPARAEADCELAHVLAARGRRDEALARAESCVPRLASYGPVEQWRKQSAERLLAELRDARRRSARR